MKNQFFYILGLVIYLIASYNQQNMETHQPNPPLPAIDTVKLQQLFAIQASPEFSEYLLLEDAKTDGLHYLPEDQKTMDAREWELKKLLTTQVKELGFEFTDLFFFQSNQDDTTFDMVNTPTETP
ncbi:MAG: hypothetical protein KDC24_08545 [Saprospiraceae bacterium]|nr:hypothetical protein [Saprospiraceae bacterium]